MLNCLGLISHNGNVQTVEAHRVQNYGIIREYLALNFGIIPEFRILLAVDHGVADF